MNRIDKICKRINDLGKFLIISKDLIIQLRIYKKIYVLVSGGIDSTYLFEVLKYVYDKKVYPVNCFNPFEFSKTLDEIKKEKNFISVKSDKTIKFGLVIRNAFLNLPKSREMKPYSKKVFGCCRILKHEAFKKSKEFTKKNTVIISGIKYSDGFQRRLWLTSLKTGNTTSKGTIIVNAPTFFHIHKWNARYCYPFRDYKEKELPNEIINTLKIKYPNLTHSGCILCPVLVRFEKKIRKNGNDFDLYRLEKSIEFAKKLNVYEE